MLESFRVLKAINAMGAASFTASEIADQTGVALKTVKTVIWRNSELLEQESTEKTGGRGRPAVRYRLRPSGARELEKRLAAVDRALTPQIEQREVPLALLAAEEMLCEEKAPYERTFLALAALGLKAGRSSLAERASALVEAHVKAVEALIALVELEQLPEADRTRGRVSGVGTRCAEALELLEIHAPEWHERFSVRVSRPAS